MATPYQSNTKEVNKMTHSRQYYIDNNDFEGAKERLDNTNDRWRSHWYETCVEIFNACTEWSKKYVLDPIAKAVRKLTTIKVFAPKVRNEDITFSEGCVIQSNEDRAEKCYLIEFFDENKNSICSKVGTTIRTIQQRVREELSSKTYKKMGAVSCVIHRVYDCKGIPAEGLESYFRANYIRKYPNSFCKNDRFICAKFDLAEADKIYSEYVTA